MTKILIIDNDIETVTPLTTHLQQQGFVVESHPTAEEGLKALFSDNFGLVILDTFLPDVGNKNVFLKAREKSFTPTLIFSSNGNEEHRIICLEAGADDYVIKPVPIREISARVKGILNRTQHISTTTATEIKTGSLTLNPLIHLAMLSNSTIDLTSTEFHLLHIMAKNAGHVVSKNELSLLALKRPLTKADRSVDVHISSIRQKMHRYSTEKYIKTVRGEGYLLINK